MKRFLILFLLAVPAFGQVTNGRWDWVADTTTGTGQMLPVLALPGAYVQFFINCTALPCTTPAVTYQGEHSSSTCPSTTPLVWQYPVGTGCKATADSNGNFGGWFQAGSYQYVLTISGHQSGPYAFDVGFGGGGGGGGGCTTSGLVGQAQGANGVGGCTPIVTKVNGVALTDATLPNFVDTAGMGGISFQKDSTHQITASTTPLAVQVEDSATGVSQTTIDFNSTTPAAPAGSSNCIWQNDTATGRKSCYVPNSNALAPLVIPPIAGQYVILHPSTCSAHDVNVRTVSACFANGAAESATLTQIYHRFVGFSAQHGARDFQRVCASGWNQSFKCNQCLCCRCLFERWGSGVSYWQKLRVGSNSTNGSFWRWSWPVQQVTQSTIWAGSVIPSVTCYFETDNSGTQAATSTTSFYSVVLDCLLHRNPGHFTDQSQHRRTADLQCRHQYPRRRFQFPIVAECAADCATTFSDWPLLPASSGKLTEYPVPIVRRAEDRLRFFAGRTAPHGLHLRAEAEGAETPSPAPARP